MILHAAELWAALAICFLSGCLVGSVIYRAIGLTGAARFQSRLAHGVDRTLRILEWRLLPWGGRGPVPLPRVVPVPPPDYRHADPVPPAPPIVWGEEPGGPSPPSLEPAPPRSVFEAEPLIDAVRRGDAAGTRPVVLGAPRQGIADDLAAIRGLGKRHAARLQAIGIYHFSPIAAWTPQEAAWVGAYLDIGDAVRDRDWVGQATRVAGSDDPLAAAAAPPKKPPKPRAKRGKAKKKTGEAGEGGSTPDGEGAVAEAPADNPEDATPRDGVPPAETAGAAAGAPSDGRIDPVEKAADRSEEGAA